MSENHSLPDIKSIFGRALELDDQSQRDEYLRQACAASPSMRAEVDELLGMHEGAKGFMPRPAVEGIHDVTAAGEPLPELAGSTVGPYKLLQQIGEGGMGVVYMAEQERPVRRKVALKIIKPGMDSRQVVARFEAERQALAMMDHANIAKVLDAGTTDQGRPYFVMELVHGVPITEYCDANKLSPRARLELFVAVCRAIQHAHQKGIIHRDIKPSNVLVTMYDDKPVPKVIDFGVAKAVESRLTEKTLFTQYGALVGTFEYMSPEQADLNALGVDTRSDVYSLGVLLYEMLTGTTPLERSQLRDAAFGEIVRRIKEEEPLRPSVRLSTSASLGKVAAARKMDAAKLSSLVRGELDWIVMRCLEKDRTRRYDGANDLAKDVERYLADERVEACPPTLGYQLRKAYRKHRGSIWTAAAFAAVLLMATVTSLRFGLNAQRAERRALEQEELAVRNAEEARISAEDAEKQRADAELARHEAEQQRAEAELARIEAAQQAKDAKAISDFLVETVIAAADPNTGARYDITLREVLDRSVERLQQQFPEPSLVAANIALRLGEILSRTSESFLDHKGDILVGRGYRDRKELLGELDPSTLEALEMRIDHSGWTLSQQDIPELYRLRQQELGDEHPDTLRAKSRVLGLRAARASKGGQRSMPEDEFQELKTQYEELIATQQALLSEDHEDVQRSIGGKAKLYLMQRQWDNAVAMYQRCVELCESRLGKNNPHVVRPKMSIVHAYLRVGNREEALKTIHETLAVTSELLGPSHQHNKTLRELIFSILMEQQEYDAVESYLKREVVYGGERGWVAIDRLGAVYALLDKGEERTDFCRDLLARYANTPDPMLAGDVARLCLIRPTNQADILDQAIALARRATSLDTVRDSITGTREDRREFHGRKWTELVCGLAEYRAGEYERAAEWIDKVHEVETSDDWKRGGRRRTATCLALKAMTEYQLGKKEQAAETLEGAKKTLDSMASFFDHDPECVLMARMAYDEARALIENASSR